LLTAALAPCATSAQDAVQAAEVRRQLRFSVVLSNPRPTELRDQQLWLYLPASESPIQQIDSVNVSSDHSMLSDALGHNILQLRFSNFAPLATKVVSIAVNVLLRDASESAALKHPGDWLATERYIETSDARIQALASRLRQPTVQASGLAIYEWLRQNMHYAGYIADDLGALYAVTQRSGDCTEYAYLAVALARANGIPARMVGGYVTDRNIAPRAEDYHNWAELHIDGAWRLLDAQKENWLTPAQQYIAFRFYRDKIINPVGLAHRFHSNGELQIRL
jgi:transglutaminase-like putative cysteine protease